MRTQTQQRPLIRLEVYNGPVPGQKTIVKHKKRGTEVIRIDGRERIVRIDPDPSKPLPAFLPLQ